MTTCEVVEQLKSLRKRCGDAAQLEKENASLDVQALDVALGVLTEGELDDGFVTLAEANETLAWDKGLTARKYDRHLFVRNLGWLLSQTRCGVVSCELYGDQDREYVIVRYDHGGRREIDVTADSYLAIIKDVAKQV